MSKYQKLRLIITDRLHDIACMSKDDTISYAKQTELRFLLAQIDRLERAETIADQELEFEAQAKAVNESLSEAAEMEWNKEQGSFLYQGVPSFDKLAWEKILIETSLKKQAA